MKKYLFCIVAVGLLAGCRSHKKVVEEMTTDAGTTPPTTQVTVPAVNRVKGMTGKLNFTALQQGTKRASSGGSIRMKRDEMIQVRLVALIVEVGRMELTPDYLMVQDRLNKQYVKVAWADVPELKEAGADFSTLQQLFWGEYPGAEKGLTLTLNKSTSLRLDYADWTKLGKQRFPGQMTLTIQSGQKSYGGIFNYSNLQADDDLRVEPTTISSSYKQVSLDKILKQLTK